ncbi:uncharacterized protein LOC131065999 [Cryptomeria japonica]|uniref:uncharacterized protein LOC131065999 n=1 Tax=Cryptomeria japonica TaxID=3369 RepID=UPI0027D9E06A|nr:uncharacterized protein LOC131065999 [Cryptomeria japonica]
MDKKIAKLWKLPPEFEVFNNSTKINRKKTKWLAPNPHWYKLNFDGSTQNACQAGGGVICDHQGNTVATYEGNLKNHTVTQAEGMALLWGLRFSTTIGIKHLETDGNSQIIMEAVRGRFVAGWKVDFILRDARMLLTNLDGFSICHIFREGNVVVDSMVAVGRLQNGLRCWRNLDLLPMITKEILETEKTKSNDERV